MKLSELMKQNKYFPTLLFYGPLGTGKTAFVTQAGKDSLILDFDRGLKTGLTMDDTYTPQRHDIDCEDFYEDDQTKAPMWPKAQAFVNSLANKHRNTPAMCPRVAIIDTFTGMVKCCKANIQKRAGKVGRPLEIQDWGLMFIELEHFLNTFRSLPCIKIVTGHDMTLEDKQGNLLGRRLLCPGKKLPTDVAGFFDDVFYCKKVKKGPKINYILTSNTVSAEVRTRTNFKDDFDMNDGLDKFIECLDYVDGMSL